MRGRAVSCGFRDALVLSSDTKAESHGERSTEPSPTRKRGAFLNAKDSKDSKKDNNTLTAEYAEYAEKDSCFALRSLRARR